jgi:carbonic anhydrase/acetyltransferase-like protein (isoleucine patch superfamily)
MIKNADKSFRDFMPGPERPGGTALENIVSFMDKSPKIGADVFIDPSSRIIGDVTLKERSSVWPLCVLRGDNDRIVIGEETAVLDQVMIEAPFGQPVLIGDRSLISHGARLHGCRIHGGALVGIGAIVLDGAEIGPGAVIGAGSLVPPKMVVPENVLVLGLPGKVVRRLTTEEAARTLSQVEEVVKKAGQYLETMA